VNDFQELADAFMKDGEDESSKEKTTQAQLLIELALVVDLSHTPDGDAYARVPVDGHFGTFPLSGSTFRKWLVGKFYKQFGKPPQKQAMQGALAVLESRAHFESPERPVHVRIAESDGRIYLDLANDQYQVVEISVAGWRVVVDPPILFRRTKSTRPLPTPVAGGTVTTLRQFLNLGHDTNWHLCLFWLLAAFRARGPYPILILQGEQGSAKTTNAKLLRRLIDPSISPVRTPPRDARDLLIAATNSHVVAYDNLSGLQHWLSDALCRVSTGTGLSTRALYTDGEEVFFEVTRPIILNGIDQLTERADLADRAVVLTLPPIEVSRRQDEAQLHAEFERELPKILGALLSAVSGAMARLPFVKLSGKPRMADFATWSTAAEIPLGLPEGTFNHAYHDSRAEAVRETLDADPVGAALIALMDTLSEQGVLEYWEGTVTELKQRLEAFVDEGTRKSGGWPKSPQVMSNRLRRQAPFLREYGIQIRPPTKGAKGRRLLAISRNRSESVATSATLATQSSATTCDQSVALDPVGGDLVGEAANGSVTSEGLPPASSSMNSLIDNHVAKVARVATVSPVNAEPDVCPHCGLVCWQRLGGVLVCPNCGRAAAEVRDGTRTDSVERFEV
jgi:hypothetical protein